MTTINAKFSTPGHDYYVISSTAKMPNSCWGQYANVAVISQPAGARPPKQIRETARGTVRAYRGALFSGKTDRSAHGRAIATLTDMAKRLATAERRANNAEAADYHRGEGC